MQNRVFYEVLLHIEAFLKIKIYYFGSICESPRDGSLGTQC